jgi:hypothetical protein
MKRSGWTFSMTNWTIGAWYHPRLQRWGVDIGPLEYVSPRRKR